MYYIHVYKRQVKRRSGVILSACDVIELKSKYLFSLGSYIITGTQISSMGTYIYIYSSRLASKTARWQLKCMRP